MPRNFDEGTALSQPIEAHSTVSAASKRPHNIRPVVVRTGKEQTIKFRGRSLFNEQSEESFHLGVDNSVRPNGQRLSRNEVVGP